MRTTSIFRTAIMLAALLGLCLTVQAAEPPPPMTLARFLGIPQTLKKLREGLVNRKGNHPKWEKKPPLKPLAAEANLEAPNAAIKAAAQIKVEEDLKQQKVKAIKYLAEIGCGCYPGVKEALMAALDDCTEEVRYQAAIAFCEASGNPCTVCNKDSCCDEEVMKRLKDMALGQDEQGCYKEPSARVRAAALNALNACERIVPPTVKPEVKELPEELPKELPRTPTPADRAADSARRAGITALVSPVSTSRLAEPGTDSATADPSDGLAYVCDSRCRESWAPRPCAPGVGPETTLAPAKPGEKVPGAPGAEEPYYPPPTALAGTFGGAAGPAPVVPNMIGDFFGGGLVFNGFPEQIGTDATVAIAGGDRRTKIMENNLPIPVDRVFTGYNHFHNAVRSIAGRSEDFDRFTTGVEKTFLDRLVSVEVRVPWGLGLEPSQLRGQSLSGDEFGNLAVTFKTLLWQRPRNACGVGLGMVFPTGDDAEIIGQQLRQGLRRPSVTVENEAVHLQPFVGMLGTPTERLFWQAFTAIDFDANGNLVVLSPMEPTRIFDQDLLFADLKVGYWAYRNPSACWLTGVAPVVELHYTTTLQDAEGVVDPYPYYDTLRSVSNPANRLDVLNITCGCHFELGPCSTFTVAAVAPLRDDSPRSFGQEDNVFDAEIAVQFNRRF